MARTVTYTGELGASINFTGLGRFDAGVPRSIDDEEAADQLLAKGYFHESPAPVYPAEEGEELVVEEPNPSAAPANPRQMKRNEKVIAPDGEV
ncbi:MAG: hypothetical protein HXX17_11970 [Geobacteraceae bacterium]|nr:hypothetical protein [Geobacteraceae bacterium]